MVILSPVLFASCSQSRYFLLYFLLFIALSFNIPIPMHLSLSHSTTSYALSLNHSTSSY